MDTTVDQKPVNLPVKSSMEILSELFESFDAKPPLIIKSEKKDEEEYHKKSKNGKKKHKKDKKHKKKEKKSRKSSDKKIDLAEILIKQEKGITEQKVKIEGTDLSFNIENIKYEKSDEDKGIEKLEIKVKTIKDEVEVREERSHKRRKRKHSVEKSKKKKRKRDESRSSRQDEAELQRQIDDLRNKIEENHRKRSRSRERRREKSLERRHKQKNDDFYTSRVRDEDDSWLLRDRNKTRERRRYRRSSSHDHIDKKKLLEIARKNAIHMMKSGSLPGALTLGPQAQEKVIAAIKAGGKTIEELTDFCKTLSKQEELGELSPENSDKEESDNDDKMFNHPFQIKDRPTSITMNIKNSVPLPIKTTQERTSELRLQFPVSSGQQHRKNENEWIPVVSKKSEAPPPPPPQSQNVQVTSPKTPEEQLQNVDIGSIVSQRLSALRKLQENPNNPDALSEMQQTDRQMQNWAQSKQQPNGQFLGSTGAQILTQAELATGYQAWAKKDQLICATPVSGGMGMHLLQKMGWKPGEGLGKEKTGTLEPLLLEVKLDKKGLVTNEEQKKKKKVAQSYSLQNKHPVSLLGEYASKKKLGAPKYELCFECGPDHKKNFLFKVILNGFEYKPNIASANKKEAKAASAIVCLQHLGLLPVVEQTQS